MANVGWQEQFMLSIKCAIILVHIWHCWDHRGLLHHGAVWTIQHTATWWHCLAVLKVLTARLAASKKSNHHGSQVFPFEDTTLQTPPSGIFNLAQMMLANQQFQSTRLPLVHFVQARPRGTGCLASRSYTAQCSPRVGSYIWRWSRWRLWSDC